MIGCFLLLTMERNENFISYFCILHLKSVSCCNFLFSLLKSTFTRYLQFKLLLKISSSHEKCSDNGMESHVNARDIVLFIFH
jgi:hypothetical protein